MRTTLGRITILSVLLITLGTGLFLVASWTVHDVLQEESALVIEAMLVESVTAKSFLVFDLESGTELLSKEKDVVLPIASITKLATAASFRRVGDMQSTTTILWSDVATEGRAGKLGAYQVYNNHELLYPLLLESSNDAAAAIARTAPEVLSNMNTFASSSGLLNTLFSDTSGLSDKNVSTAYELMHLVSALHEEQPHIFDITQLTQYIGEHTGWMNNSPFIHDPTYKGGKHGFTYEANRTGVFLFEETVDASEKRIFGYVLLGSDDLAKDIDQLRRTITESVHLE